MIDIKNIKQSFEKKGFDFSGKYIPYAFDMQEYMKRYDVVFRTPMKQPFEALPIGNGDVADAAEIGGPRENRLRDAVL